MEVINIFKQEEYTTPIIQMIDNDFDSIFFANPKDKLRKVNIIRKTGNFNAAKRETPSYIILPDQKSKQFWDIIICFWVLYSLAITPINIGWNMECFTANNGKMFSDLSTVSALFFFLDIFINCFTSYLDEKNVYIMDLELIIKNYLNSYLVVDVLSSIPFDKIFPFDESYCYKPVMAPSKIPHLLFFLRGLKLNKYFALIERFFSKFTLQIRFAKLFIFILYLAHFIGNLFSGNSPAMVGNVFIGCNTKYSESDPMRKICQHDLLHDNFINVYFYSLFIGMIMTLGTDVDIVAPWENIILFMTIIFSTIINATIYSNVTIMLTKFSSGISPVLQEKIDSINQYMLFMKFDPEFRQQIEEYHINIWFKQRNMIYEDSFLGDMSESLQKGLLLQQWKYSFFAESKFFSLVSKYFIYDMVIHLKPKIFMKSDVVYSEGETGTEVYFYIQIWAM